MFRNVSTAKEVGPLNYNSALDLLCGSSFKKIYNNTYLFHENDGSIALIFHETKIIIYHPDGSLTLNTGGIYQTKTTKSRLNEYLENITINTVNGFWAVSNGGHFSYEFEDHMTISSDGRISTCPVGIDYIEEETGEDINSLKDMITVLENASTDILKKLWKKSLIRIYIAYYASLEFLALVAASVTGTTQHVIKQRFENA